MSMNTVHIKGKQYEQAVLDFLKNRGHFICVTDDAPFATLLRTTLYKHLGAASDSVSITNNPDMVLRMVRDAVARYCPPLLILERMLDNKDMSYLVRQLKNAFADMHIIILTNEAQRQRLVLLHEIGADNFITKPISANGLIEKIAFTIKPQSKLGQLVESARTFIQKNAPREALKVCKQILDIKPNSPAAYLLIGDSFRCLNKLDRAQEAYEQANKFEEMYLEPLRKLAELHGEMGNTGEQLRYLEKLDELSPLNVDRKIDMGQLQFSLGNEEAANMLFDQAVQLATKEAMSYISEVAGRVANICAEKAPERAEVFLRQALATKGGNLTKEDIATFNRLGIVLRRQGKWREALEEYKKAAQISPDDENLYYNMAMACAEGKNTSEAVNHMSAALRINPDLPRHSATIACNVGTIFMQAGQFDKAEQYCRLAVELDETYSPAHSALKQIERHNS